MKKLYQRWATVPWKLRWLTYVCCPVLIFYSIENLRGHYALRKYQKLCESQGEWFNESDRRKQRSTNLVNLLDLEIGATLRNDSLFEHDLVEDFDPPNRVEPKDYYGYEVCRPYNFTLGFQSQTLDRREAAQRYLTQLADSHNLLDEFAKALATADHMYIPLNQFDEHSIIGNSVYAAPDYFRLRSSAFIQVDDADRAFRDIEGTLKLASLLLNSDFQGYYKFGDYARITILDSIWEGLNSRTWTSQQCIKIAAMLLADAAIEYPINHFLGERALSFDKLTQLDSPLERWRNIGSIYLDYSTIGARRYKAEKLKYGALKLYLTLTPDGWQKMNWINLEEKMRLHFAPNSKQPALPFYLKKPDFEFWGISTNPFSEDIYIGYPAKLYNTLARLAAIATANEAYYLKHHHYPSKLGELAPDFLISLPKDPFSGNSFIYLPAGTRSSRPVVYSVGMNGVDDGGYTLSRRGMGDLVWQYEFPENFTIKHYQESRLP